ncbi:hypothetical protein IACHDJAJ_00153 [Aeromonas phage vB_AdhS_TS3]|nr:hypothetical protein IACHDJAJ_00153 [Aeromonas phage vB_AdhS_TS3]
MAIERVVRCDSAECRAVMPQGTGFVILGNIHKVGADKENVGGFDCVGGGLVGNSLEDGVVVFRALYYCEHCMAKILGFQLVQNR